MSFLDFFYYIVSLFGSAGTFIISFFVLIVALGIYKFVKEWLPW